MGPAVRSLRRLFSTLIFPSAHHLQRTHTIRVSTSSWGGVWHLHYCGFKVSWRDDVINQSLVPLCRARSCRPSSALWFFCCVCPAHISRNLAASCPSGPSVYLMELGFSCSVVESTPPIPPVLIPFIPEPRWWQQGWGRVCDQTQHQEMISLNSIRQLQGMQRHKDSSNIDSHTSHRQEVVLCWKMRGNLCQKHTHTHAQIC